MCVEHKRIHTKIASNHLNPYPIYTRLAEPKKGGEEGKIEGTNDKSVSNPVKAFERRHKPRAGGKQEEKNTIR